MRNQGTFSVTREFFIDLKPGDGVNLFHGMVVLQTSQNHSTGSTDYYAIHEDFEEVPEGAVTPTYTAKFIDGGSVYPVWEKIDGYK